MFTTLLIVLATAAPAAQSPTVGRSVSRQEIPPRIEAFLEKCETSRRGAIARMEFELRGLKARAENTPQAARRMKKIEANLRALRANKEPVVAALSFPPKVGAIGRLPQLTCHVDQILSADEMLVSCRFSLKVRAVRNFRPRLETVVRPVSFLVRGMPTKKNSEGADIQLLDVFEITGSRTYRSVDGKPIKVLVISPFDMHAIEPYFRAMKISRSRPPE